MAIAYRFTPDMLIEQDDGNGSYSIHTLEGAEKKLYDDNLNPGPYADIILKKAEDYGVPEAHIRATILGEARFEHGIIQPGYVSFDHGVGVMQITDKGLKAGHSDAELGDPDLNIDIGTKFMAKLMAMNGGFDPARMASMYNCGPGAHGPKSGSGPWGYCEYTIPTTGAHPYISKVVRAYNYGIQNPLQGSGILSSTNLEWLQGIGGPVGALALVVLGIGAVVGGRYLAHGGLAQIQRRFA